MNINTENRGSASQEKPASPSEQVPGKDYYQILGLSRDASFEDIEQAYDSLFRDKDAPEETLNKAEQAARVLLDPKKRAIHDAFLKARYEEKVAEEIVGAIGLGVDIQEKPGSGKQSIKKIESETEISKALGVERKKAVEKKETIIPKVKNLSERLDEEAKNPESLARLKKQLEGERVYQFIEDKRGVSKRQYLKLEDINKDEKGNWVSTLVVYTEDINGYKEHRIKNYNIGKTTYREWKKVKEDELPKAGEEVKFRADNKDKFGDVVVLEKSYNYELKRRDGGNLMEFPKDRLRIYKDDEGNTAYGKSQPTKSEAEESYKKELEKNKSKGKKSTKPVIKKDLRVNLEEPASEAVNDQGEEIVKLRQEIEDAFSKRESEDVVENKAGQELSPAETIIDKKQPEETQKPPTITEKEKVAPKPDLKKTEQETQKN